MTPAGSRSPRHGLACASGEGTDSLGPVQPHSAGCPPEHGHPFTEQLGWERGPESAAAPAQPPGAGCEHSQLGIPAAQPGEATGPGGNVRFPDSRYSPATREIKATSLHLVGFEAQFS